VRVHDTLVAFGDLASFRRKRLPARVVAITGSNGKTTTKEMIASILEAAGERVGKSAGNENNLVGVPKTILAFSGDETVDVIEMGMNRRGEIERLAQIADPDVGVLTNVGPAHLEGLGSIENVAAAKGELARALRGDVPLVIDGDDPWLVRIADARHGPTLRIGNTIGDVRIASVQPAREGAQQAVLVIRNEACSVRISCVGAHNVRNAALAAAAAVALDLPNRAIVRGIESFRLSSMRLEIQRTPGGALVWNDTYNANPASMKAALAALAADRSPRRMAALGEMGELGADSDAFHHEIGRAAAAAGLDRVVAVGPRAAAVAAGAREAGLPSLAVHEA
jgi:UDP-N-acetylmuramoyl-tripeptide--D-alanyl-D-alanine ligase